MEEIRDIPIPPEDRVFFYDERDKTLYAAKMEEVSPETCKKIFILLLQLLPIRIIHGLCRRNPLCI